MPAELPILSVGDLSELLKQVVESQFPLVAVAGEVSNLVRAGSGHVYFTLKDADAQIKAVMWKGTASRIRFELHDGLEVIAVGPVEVYAPRGNYQIVVDQLQPQGVGALELAFRQLQAKLAAEGLFDADRKRPLPRFPRKIALITSPTGAAVRDLLQVMTRRWPSVQVVLLPVAVQGPGAAQQIAQALRQVAQIPEIDIVVTGRGGGSLEDLWSFNEEVVARAIYDCPIPVVSAVGHEIDVTIADLVADRRALTPSEAGELVTPVVYSELIDHLSETQRRLANGLRQRAARSRTVLAGLAQRRCFTRPLDRIRDAATKLDEIELRLRGSMKRTFETANERLSQSAATLSALSPLNVLARGYTVTKQLPSGRLVRSIGDTQPGDTLSTLVTNGSVLSQVVRVVPD